MSSVSSAFKQPLTRTYIVNKDDRERGPYKFPLSTFSDWVSANSGKINQVGSLYVVPGTASGATFADVVQGDNGANALGGPREEESDLDFVTSRKNLRDLGEQVVVGDNQESRLLVFRLVQEANLSTVATGGDTFYIIVENNCSDIGGDSGRFSVRAARI
jgi:hypothetical protein